MRYFAVPEISEECSSSLGKKWMSFNQPSARLRLWLENFRIIEIFICGLRLYVAIIAVCNELVKIGGGQCKGNSFLIKK